MSDEKYFCMGRQAHLMQQFGLAPEAFTRIMAAVQVYRGEQAMRHLMRVASSLESMVLGEREILTQVREAFDLAMKHRLAGDRLRVTGRSVVETAKKVFTDTDVAKISVVGVGMRSHAGVAATMFKTLAERGINIEAISTSEIKVSVLIDEDETELAVRVLHTAYGLDAPAA